MLLSATLSALLLAGSAKAFFRLPCDNPVSRFLAIDHAIAPLHHTDSLPHPLLARATSPPSALSRLPLLPPHPTQLIIERADPIISPGKVAGHTHTISGGSNFSPSATFAELRKSECSSCNAKADLSGEFPSEFCLRVGRES